MPDVVRATPEAATLEELRRTRRQLRIALVAAGLGGVAGIAGLVAAMNATDEADRAEWRASGAESKANNADNHARRALNEVAQLRRELAVRPHPAPPPAPPAFPPFVTRAAVASVTGEAAVAEGDGCRVEVQARSSGGLNCRVEVTCGETILYGDKATNGYVLCGIEDGRPTVAVDDDETGTGGDPKLELDVPGRRVVVSDPGYAVTLTWPPG